MANNDHAEVYYEPLWKPTSAKSEYRLIVRNFTYQTFGLYWKDTDGKEFGWIEVKSGEVRRTKVYNGVEKNLILTPMEPIAIKFMGGEHDGELLTTFYGMKADPGVLDLQINMC